MEHGLQNRLEVSLDHHLGNAVGDGRNPEQPGSPTSSFGISTRLTGGGK